MSTGEAGGGVGTASTGQQCLSFFAHFLALFGLRLIINNHQNMRRCRFVGEKDSAGHPRGEGSLTYTNGDRFEVQTNFFLTVSCFEVKKLPFLYLCQLWAFYK